MFRRFLTFISALIFFSASAQNDLDAIRYSQMGVGGTSRFIAMGGAFGAIGADFSTASFNPAGLGLYRKGEIGFSAAIQTYRNKGDIYNTSSSLVGATPKFNNFGLVTTITPQKDPDSRHILAFTVNQLQNFKSATRFAGYTNSSSIAKDMLLMAEQNKSNSPDISANLYSAYEGMGFNTYLLDTADGKFYSYLDTKRSVKQIRDISTSGRVNDINLSYAYAYKDKFYFGASVGFPQVNYVSTTTHRESDDRDSMRIYITPDTSYTTYLEAPPYLLADKLGFNSLNYEEYFKTTGSGINLKLGGIFRVNDALRLGFYYHTPTFYNLQDVYYNSLSVSFDKQPSNPISIQEPENSGYFKYKIITPSRYSANVCVVIKKLMLIGLDYEFVNYRSAQLASDDVADFAGVNSVIRSKYSGGHNLRFGAELNTKPWMFRIGYNMQGSPYGDVFSGNMVRNTMSAGIGFRSESGFYADFVVSQVFGQTDYYFFSALNTKATATQNTSIVGASVGIKF